MGAELTLALMARAPVPGEVKTRMQPILSCKEAAELHRELVFHACRTLAGAGMGRVELWLSGNASTSFLSACQERGVTSVHRQVGSDLGERMLRVCRSSLERADAVLLVGSDVPAIDHDYLAAAVAALSDRDLVIGPARDGGYVLLGLRRAPAELFAGIEWGGPSVLRATLDRALKLGWTLALLPSLPDIDRPEDLVHLPPALRRSR